MAPVSPTGASTVGVAGSEATTLRSWQTTQVPGSWRGAFRSVSPRSAQTPGSIRETASTPSTTGALANAAIWTEASTRAKYLKNRRATVIGIGNIPYLLGGYKVRRAGFRPSGAPLPGGGYEGARLGPSLDMKVDILYYSYMNGSAQAAPDEGKIMISFLSAAHALEDRLDSALAEAGLSMPKLTVLTHLVEEADPVTLSALAEKLSCVRSNITQLVDRLEADGLVRRVADPSDRRSIRAALTPLGKERQAAGARQLATVQGEFRDSLSTGDRTTLARMLDALKRSH